MTGFGKSQAEALEKVITVEVRSLNSKMLDINFRAPSVYREKELDIRARVSQRLERGKIDVTLGIESKSESPVISLNKTLALKYYEQLRDLGREIPGQAETDMLSLLIRMPDVLKSEKEELTEEEWEAIGRAIDQAIAETDRFRLSEGAVLERDLRDRTSRILALLDQVGPFEKERIAALRARFEQQIQEMFHDGNFDRNRFEQELLYYFERLDITEEKVRLKKHCEYFTETLHDPDSPGKKLGFISQEIGREINTLGSKANDARIQKIVVQMKDELEKIKEQLANIL
jgi:uncharacterized protein (TIGR00255 family)